MDNADSRHENRSDVESYGFNNRSLIGKVIAGKYEILSVLGEGGMSSVYEARDVVIGRVVALKLLSTIRSTDDRAVMRFKKEAMAAGRLSHPNIVQLYDVGIHDDGTPYMVMDCVRGDTLSDRIHSQGHLPVTEVLKIFAQVCDALEHAHQNGVVHRDIKPSNLMITKSVGGDQQIKVLDFGIAKVWDEALSVQQSTRTGEVFGSPIYMSPEQAISNSKVDGRSDIYSTACAMFEALAGSAPFVGETTLHTIMKHQTDPAPTLREASLGEKFSEPLEKAIAKALSKKPDDRFQTMREFGDALRDLDRRIASGENFQENVQTGSSKNRSAKALTAASSSAGTLKAGTKITEPTKSSSPTKRNVLVAISLIALGGVCSALLMSNFNQRAQAPNTSISPITDKPTVSAATKVLSEDAKDSGVVGDTKDSANKNDESNVTHLWPTDSSSLLHGKAQTDEKFTVQELEADLKNDPNINSQRFANLDVPPAVFKTLAKFKSLEKLNLNHSRFEDSNPEFNMLFRLPLKKFVASGSTLSNIGLLSITRCPTLLELEIGGCKTLNDDGLKNLGRYCQPQKVWMQDSQFSDEAVRALARCKYLRMVILNDNPYIEGKTLGLLSKLPNFNSISLGGTGISDKYFSAISGLKQLRVLDVKSTKLTPASAPVIAKLEYLKNLNVSKTHFGDASLKEFSKLKDLRVLVAESCPGMTSKGFEALHKEVPNCVIYNDMHPMPTKKSED